MQFPCSFSYCSNVVVSYYQPDLSCWWADTRLSSFEIHLSNIFGLHLISFAFDLTSEGLHTEEHSKSNAIDGWASVPSWIFCLTTGKILFSVLASDLYCFSHISFDDIQVVHENTLLSKNSYWFLHQNKSPLCIFPSKLSCYEICGLVTFAIRWAIS